MKIKNRWSLLFFFTLLLDIIGIATHNQVLQLIAKPLLMPLVILFFVYSTRMITGKLKLWVILALIFSWIGDVLLMFESRNQLFFLFGLSAFLIAHIFYCIFFNQVKKIESVPSKVVTMIIVVVYYTTLMLILAPSLGEMKIPVRIYGIVISLMFMLAMHMLFLKNKGAGRLMMAGALLFVISDSILAWDKFYQSFPLAGIFIMLTYGLAQWFIASGAVSYLRNQSR